MKTEAEIIELCLKGDTQAEFQLFKLYSKAIYNCCYRIVNHQETARDMLQEVFVKIFDHLKSYSNEYKFYTWAQRIAVNHCINHQKKKGVDYEFREEWSTDIAPQADEDFEYRDEQVKQVRDSMMQLPSGYREILSLYLLEGYDHKEIAEILGISASTSKSQYSRAKQKVRQIMQSNYGR